MTDRLSKVYDAGLFDLDGVCYLGSEPIGHAPEELTQAVAGGMRHSYVTNNASRSAEDVAQQLASLGFPAVAQDVITSAMVASHMILEQFGKGAKVLVVGGQGLMEAIVSCGLKVVSSADDCPDVVVQGFSPDIDWLKLSEAALAIRGGAAYIATNMDKTIPRERGLMVGNGALVNAVATSTGVAPRSAGKPEPEIFHKAAEALGSKTPLFVGDNLDTDIKGAVRAGIDSLHVLTGLATARSVCLARPDVRPTYLCDDLRGLNEEYPEVQIENGKVQVGDCTAEWTGKEFCVTKAGENIAVDTQVVIDINSYRALAHASWLALDEGERIDEAIAEIVVQR